MENNLTIVIQGPLNDISINTINKYLEFAPVIISSWDNEDYNKLSHIKDKVKIVKSSYEDMSNIYNNGWIYFQCTTVYNGLLHVDTEYTLKVRSDESYPNIFPLLKRLKENPDKIHTLNIYFLKDRIQKFHMSDHLVLAKTELMKKTYGLVLDKCRNLSKYNLSKKNIGRNQIHLEYLKNGQKIPLHSERLIGISFLENLGENPNLNNSKELMCKHFCITKLKEMKGFRWACASSKGAHQTNKKNDCFTGRNDIASSESEI